MQTLLTTLSAVLILVLVAVFLLSFKIWIFKDGKFPNFHIGGNKALRDQGVSCATTQDAEAQSETRKIDITKLNKELEENNVV